MRYKSCIPCLLLSIPPEASTQILVWLILQSRLLLERLFISQQVKKFTAFWKPDFSWQNLHEPFAGLSPEWGVHSTVPTPTRPCSFKIHFIIARIISFTLGSSKKSLHFNCNNEIVYELYDCTVVQYQIKSFWKRWCYSKYISDCLVAISWLFFVFYSNMYVPEVQARYIIRILLETSVLLQCICNRF